MDGSRSCARLTTIAPMPAAARVLVVEDHPIYRQGLISALERGLPGTRCTAVGRADEALAALAADPGYDVALIDITLDDRDGLSLAAELRTRWPTLVCAVVSAHADARLVARARALGCMGFLSKALAPEALVERFARLLDGEPCFGPSRLQEVAPVAFTERQAAVLERVARGLSSRSIAAELGIAERTVKDHLAVIFARLEASTRAEAVARAAALGLLPVGASSTY